MSMMPLVCAYWPVRNAARLGELGVREFANLALVRLGEEPIVLEPDASAAGQPGRVALALEGTA